MNSSYWDSKYQYYMNNQPPAAESYYNKDFADKINEARANIDNLVAEKDKSWAATGQRKDEYNAFRGTMSEYGDVYKNSKSEFGIEDHQDNYEKNKQALALAESTLSALPSSINSSSNRVLTQSQREARYNALADIQMKRRDTLMNNVSEYDKVWQNAREQQAEYSRREIAGQWSKLDEYNNAWNLALKDYAAASERLTQGEAELSDWQSRYRTWQNQQYQNAQTVWLANMSAALNRYVQALNTEMVIAQANRAMANANKLKSWDFGGGYTMEGASGKNAVYYYNGNAISAGRFLEGTGANGTQWDKWNDVWNSGVRTSGVGSDTVQAFNRQSAAGNQYNYLFR